MTALTALAVLPLYAAYGTGSFWVAAGGGLAVGAGIAALAAWLRWGMLPVAALTCVAYFLFGTALALGQHGLFGVLPTLDSLSLLAIGSVRVWMQALTLQAPLSSFDGLLIAPFVLTLVGAVIAVSLALRLRRWAFALTAPVVTLTLSVGFSTYHGFRPALTGAVFAAVAVAWSAWRARRDRAAEQLSEPSAQKQSRRRGLVVGAAAAAGLIALAAVGGVAAAAVTGTDRQVLRDHVTPPLDVRDLTSPLVSFHKLVTAEKKTDLFTVEGLPAGARVRLATLDLYDGIVYKVSGAGGAGSGVFTRVGHSIDTDAVGTAAHVTVTVKDLTGVWAPTVGYLTSIAFTGGDAKTQQDDLHYDTATGTAVVTAGLRQGDRYHFTAVIPRTPTADQLKNAILTNVALPAPAPVTATKDAAAKLVAGADTPIAQAQALVAGLQKGAFSHGLGADALISPSGHTDYRITKLLTGQQMVGDDEQYAVAMALMARDLGIPARVVMGFWNKDGAAMTTVTGADVHTWVEIPFDGFGWVAFDPTPSEDNKPSTQDQQQQGKPLVQVAQPPEVPQEPAELPPAAPLTRGGDGSPEEGPAWVWVALQIAGGTLGVIAVLLGPSIALGIARAVRRRRRARAADAADRLDGGWAEVVDAAVDVGTALPAGGTRREQAAVLEGRYPDAGTLTLAHRADTAVFGAADPSDDDAAKYWADVRTATERMARAVPWHCRLRARLFPKSLFTHRRLRTPRGDRKDRS